jgi:hypothetical protein
MKIARVSCCLFFALCVFGQSVGPANESEASKLIALEKMWNQIQMTRDSAALDNLIGERFLGTYSDGHFGRKAQFLANFKDPSYKPAVVNIQDLNVEMYGDAAVVTGVYRARGVDSGKPYEERGRFTDTWIQQNGRWECVASHASLLK